MTVTVSNISTGSVAQSAALTPTQQVVNDANRVAYGRDALGRRIGVVRFSGKLRRRVLVALSAESGQKPELLWRAVAACSCVSIDDDQISFPTTEAQVFALMDRLEDEGMAAVATIQGENFIETREENVKN